MTALLEDLKRIVGPKGWTTDPVELQPHLVEWRGAYEGRTLVRVSPATTAEVAAVVRACVHTEPQSCRKAAIPAFAVARFPTHRVNRSYCRFTA